MREYVMIGHSGRLGDYIDIVHGNGGQISKVIVNAPDVADAAGNTLSSRLADYNGWRRRWGIETEVVVEQLKEFTPRDGERYILGFSGLGQLPMKAYLNDQWGLELETLVHPRAWVSPTATLGEACVINAGCVIGSEVRVGPFTWVGRGSTIGHDGTVGDAVFFGPGAHVASGVQIGRGANIGIGSTILEFVSVGEGCVVAGGAVVRNEVEPFHLVAGVPAVVKKTVEPKVFPDKPAGIA